MRFLTKQMEGKFMTEFGLLSIKGIIGFSDVNKTVQNTETMAQNYELRIRYRSANNATRSGL